MASLMDSRVKTLIGAAALFAVIIVVVLVAQGGGDDEPAEPATAERQDKPEVEIPEGAPPKELVVEDLEEGEGDEAAPGDSLTVDYVGVLYDGGDEFDASFEGPEPFEFVLGQGGVIPGWDEGLEGMKVGGRRQLVIPPDLAYGPQGQPPDIPPDSTLVFVIDLLAIN
jgi:peptidylprolyl isomerase